MEQKKFVCTLLLLAHKKFPYVTDDHMTSTCIQFIPCNNQYLVIGTVTVFYRCHVSSEQNKETINRIVAEVGPHFEEIPPVLIKG